MWYGLFALLIALGTTRCAIAFELGDEDVDGAGQTLTVHDETVEAIFVAQASGFNDAIGWEGTDPVFTCYDVEPGFTTLVGAFKGQHEVVMTLTTPEGDVWTSGPGDRNTDDLAHARLSQIAPDTVLVEWEDLRGGGDRDYNDCVYKLRFAR
jgi:hypothetical protein